MKKRKYLLICCLVVVFVSVSLLFAIVNVKAENDNSYLINKFIYVDAGHGGKDNGASYGGVLEDEINLKIAGYLIENLIDLGAYVYTSRTDDYDLSNIYDKNKKRTDLIRRVEQINSNNVDLFISIHLNSYQGSSIKGAQVFHQNNEKSKLLATSIQNNLNVLYSDKGRKIKFGDYYLLNKTKEVGVIVECGFLSNAYDRSKLVDENHQRKIANKVTRGIVEYFI